MRGRALRVIQAPIPEPALGFLNGPAWIRTRDQRIMSPLL
jgi:hypothetical protein